MLAGVMLVDGLSQMGINVSGHSTKKGDHSLWDRFLVVISPKSSIPKKRRELCPLYTSRTNSSRLSSSPWGSYHDELDNQSSSFNQLN